MATLKKGLHQAVTIARRERRLYSAPTDGSIPPAKQKYVPTSGTYPKGFVVGSAHAGVKPSNTKFDDLALIVSKKACAAAGVFTRNMFKAAPVVTSKRVIHEHQHHGFRGVIINSGCANAVTGQGGLVDAEAMIETARACLIHDSSFNVKRASDGKADGNTAAQDTSGSTRPKGRLPITSDDDSNLLVMSTGVIGQR